MRTRSSLLVLFLLAACGGATLPQDRPDADDDAELVPDVSDAAAVDADADASPTEADPADAAPSCWVCPAPAEPGCHGAPADLTGCESCGSRCAGDP